MRVASAMLAMGCDSAPDWESGLDVGSKFPCNTQWDPGLSGIGFNGTMTGSAERSASYRDVIRRADVESARIVRETVLATAGLVRRFWSHGRGDVERRTGTHFSHHRDVR